MVDTFNAETFPETLEKYLASRQDDKTERILWENTTKGTVGYAEKLTVRLPTIEGFAAFVGVTRKTLYNWSERHDLCKDALERIKTIQQERLIDEGLAGNYNATIAKLILSNNHGMKERVDETSDDLPLNTFSDDQVDRIAERITKRSRTDGGTAGENITD